MKFSVIICGESEGRFNPSIVFQPDLRKDIVIGLHKGQSVVSLSRSLGIGEDEILNHLEFLRDGSFVKEQNGETLPNFFVALREDVLRTRKASLGLGRKIGRIYENRWDYVVETCHKLSISSRFSLERVSFVLIGAYSLDMIDKFKEEGKIMPEAPRRKSGRFYMWGVENGMEALGRYGMHSNKLNGYGFASFGGEGKRKRVSPPDHKNAILMKYMKEDSLINAYLKFQKLASSERKSFTEKTEKITITALKEYERKYNDDSYEISKESARYLKEWFYLNSNLMPSAPIYTESDMEIVGNLVDDMSVLIFDTLYKNMKIISSTFRKCEGSKYAEFPEFFCWYYHLVFTETMDYLIKKEKLSQPFHGYEFWVWKI